MGREARQKMNELLKRLQTPGASLVAALSVILLLAGVAGAVAWGQASSHQPPGPASSPSPSLLESPAPSDSPSPADSPTPSVSPSPTPSPTPLASPSPAPMASPTPSPAGFTCAAPTALPGQHPPLLAYVDALRTGAHDGYDRLVIEFSNGQPSEVDLGTQAGTVFTQSPSGRQVKLMGQNGILVSLRGADAHTAYDGPTDIKTGDKGLVEVRQVQDFEGVVQYALGVNGAPCYKVSYLSGPTRLVIDVPNT